MEEKYIPIPFVRNHFSPLESIKRILVELLKNDANFSGNQVRR